MQHEHFCIDRDDTPRDDGPTTRTHGSGVDACVGPAFDVAGVTGWLVREGEGPARCVVDGHELDRGDVLKLIAELEARLPDLPA